MDTELSFNEVSFLLGFQAYGREAERKINSFIEPLVSLFEQSGLCTGSISHQKNLYSGVTRNAVYGRMADVYDKGYPLLFAGISLGTAGPQVRVWLETTPGHGQRELIGRVIADKLPELQAINPNWTYDEIHRWRDAQIRLPLEDLFRSPNQKQTVYDFVASALDDLKTTGTVSALRAALLGAEG